ncbi:MAG: DUF3644 domain-containing protein [Bacillales bacterium]|jgi:hypothetical protein|nr:DUF3644 domain-containing protein [Bacillales bacterium]
MEKHVENILDKSQEFYLLAIEIYNKPTIKYRVDGFSFFICSAWELLFKAHLLNIGEQINYKKKNINRTISLSDAIKRIMTNDKNPIRVNLEIVVGIRNMANHLIVPEYTDIMNEVFTACYLKK